MRDAWLVRQREAQAAKLTQVTGRRLSDCVAALQESKDNESAAYVLGVWECGSTVSRFRLSTQCSAFCTLFFRFDWIMAHEPQRDAEADGLEPMQSSDLLQGEYETTIGTVSIEHLEEFYGFDAHVTYEGARAGGVAVAWTSHTVESCTHCSYPKGKASGYACRDSSGRWEVEGRLTKHDALNPGLCQVMSQAELMSWRQGPITHTETPPHS